MLEASVLFHCNLNFSSIEVEARPEVVDRCYRPMLELLDELPDLRLAVEASAHTLELAAGIDPKWVARLADEIDRGRVEFVGSGDSQIVGPLVPESVNRWNQRLGQQGYERLLGMRPVTALVNEMAWSQGLVDAYGEAGYRRVIAEWNNPRERHCEWQDEDRYRVQSTSSPRGRSLELLFADAIAFQKLQRLVQREESWAQYRGWLCSHLPPDDRARHLFVYAGDAEIFDFRPGRFASEPRLPDRGEWQRLRRALALMPELGIRWTTPARVASGAHEAAPRELVLTSPADPIPVKKQPKYNVTRWALSGRDDVGLNSACHARARELEARGGSGEEWRALCRAWASDLRTHITAERWEAARPAREQVPVALPARPARGTASLGRARATRRGRWIEIETEVYRLRLNLRRGLAIESLALRGDGGRGELRVLGSLPHGYFGDIRHGADFYSGHAVLEAPPRLRATDLEPVEAAIAMLGDAIEVRAEIGTPLGVIAKTLRARRETLEIEYGFARLGPRPEGSVRAGILTLDPESFGRRAALECCNGGAAERFDLAEAGADFDHGAAVSALISANAALGATDGRLEVVGDEAALEISWRPELCAALPLATSRRVGARRFLRLAFSLGEVDDTLRPGARLRDLALTIAPRRVAA